MFQVKVKYNLGVSNLYYPSLYEEDNYYVSADGEMAELLKIDYDEYIKKLKDNHAFLCERSYFFRSEADTQQFIDDVIMPRLIMERIAGDN